MDHVLDLQPSAMALWSPAEPARGLADRISSRTARVGVIGMGYVGLPLAQTIARNGFQVIGFDTDTNKVDALNEGRSYIKHIPAEAIARLRSDGRFEACTEFERLADMDIVLICVPTPLDKHREPDLSFVVTTTETVGRRLRRGQMIVLESTTYPGTTAEVLRPILERTGLVSGDDFFLAYSPEREDPGNAHFSTADIPKIVGGHGPVALELASAFYQTFIKQVVPVSTVEAAEAVKLTENIFRAVNIALVNELKIIYGAMNIDVWEVIEAAKTKPFGFMAFYPGPGLGGHCIPIDPFYLTWRAREFDIATRFIELAGEINTRMPYYVVDRLVEEVDRRSGKGLNGAQILLLGIAYKKNVDDMRESPSLKLIEIMEAKGAAVEFHDPHIPVVPPTREHAKLAGRRSLDLDAETIRRFDAVLIATDHDDVDYSQVVRNGRVVIDTRGVCRKLGMIHTNVVRA